MNAYATTLPRAAAGLAAGAVTGALLVALYAYFDTIPDDPYPVDGALFVGLYATVIWAIGLLVAAPLPWLVLHRLGWRSWPIAVLLGGALVFLVVLGFLTDWYGLSPTDFEFSAADNGGPTWTKGRLTRHGWIEALRFAGTFGAAGAVVGFVVWRTAYRRVAARAPTEVTSP